jgi:hypothetical protein
MKTTNSDHAPRWSRADLALGALRDHRLGHPGSSAPQRIDGYQSIWTKGVPYGAIGGALKTINSSGLQ